MKGEIDNQPFQNTKNSKKRKWKRQGLNDKRGLKKG